jgi:BirA family transcriptional regulator, biotin operon repressor / biotin---[acetyl-CoA-carboxylase] ligase
LRSNPPDASALPDDLKQALARARPRLGVLASSVRHHPSIGSTNDIALQDGVEGTVVIADEQLSGRGRRGHTWFSPPGAGLYVSVVLAPGRARTEPARATTLLTLAAGVAIVEGIESATGLRADLKWPNDVYVGRRKLAGILAESSGRPGGVVVTGYGINVVTAAYPPELRERVTALETELGRAIDRYLVLAETLAALASRYDDLLDARFDAILDAWRRRAPTAAGARVSWSDASGERTGITDGIDRDGALLVRSESGIERIVSGELRWL